jgi:hypothetical protein
MDCMYRFRVVELFQIRYILVRIRIRILGSIKEIHGPGYHHLSYPCFKKSSYFFSKLKLHDIFQDNFAYFPIELAT